MDGFRSTWSQASATFGDGEPTSGSHFDSSDRLQELQGVVEAADPRSNWTGTAADEYAVTNRRQAALLSRLAELDRRLATQVDRSGEVVTAGRRDLDVLRAWVADAAASTPPGNAGDWLRLRIASAGIGHISEIVDRATTELNAIGREIGVIAQEYDAVVSD
jgi:uncharacterized protein YukE